MDCEGSVTTTKSKGKPLFISLHNQCKTFHDISPICERTKRNGKNFMLYYNNKVRFSTK